MCTFQFCDYTDNKEATHKEKKSDVSEKHTIKGKELIWLWIVGGCVVGGLGYLVLKRFSLI